MLDLICFLSKARGKAKSSPFHYRLLWKCSYLQWFGIPRQPWVSVCANKARTAPRYVGCHARRTCRILMSFSFFNLEKPAVPCSKCNLRFAQMSKKAPEGLCGAWNLLGFIGTLNAGGQPTG